MKMIKQILGVTLGLMLVTTMQAQNWTGAVDSDMSNVNNWDGSFTNNRSFGTGVTNFNPTLSGALSLSGRLNFSTSGYTIGSNNGTITFTNTDAAQATNTSGINIIATNIVLSRASTQTVTFTQAGGGSLEITGNISGAAILVFGQVSGAGMGTLVLSGSNSNAGGVQTANSGGTIVLKNQYALGTGALTLGNNSTSVVNGNSSLLIVDNALNLTATSGDGITITAASGALTFNKQVTLAGATNAANKYNQNVNVVSSTLTFNAGIQGGSIGINKKGNGTLIVNGNVITTATTYVEGGTLLVNGNLSNSAVSVTNNSTFGSNGTIGGVTTIDNGGKLRVLASGNGSGLTFNDNLILNNATNSTITFDVLGEASYGSLYLNGAGNNISGAKLSIDLSGAAFTALQTAETYNLDLFGNAAAVTALNGLTFIDTDWTLNSGIYTWNSVLDNVDSITFNKNTGILSINMLAVPEPSVYFMLGVGVLLLAVTKLRRAKV